MVDESSLASTRQMREFLEKIGPQDHVLLIGDTRQHQGVEAGKPFEQMVQAGMRTSSLTRSVRQKDPELKAAVDAARPGATCRRASTCSDSKAGSKKLPIPCCGFRPSPEIMARAPTARLSSLPTMPRAVRSTMLSVTNCKPRGIVSTENHSLRVLVPRQELTGADRKWAVRYQANDVLRYGARKR